MDDVGKQRVVFEGNVDAADAKDAEAGNAQTHDRATVERNEQGVGLVAFTGCLRRAHVGVGRGLHADETGQQRQKRTEHKGTGGNPAEAEADEHEDHGAKHREHLVLAHQKRHRALADVARDAVHVLVAVFQTLHAEVEKDREQQSNDTDGDGGVGPQRGLDRAESTIHER